MKDFIKWFKKLLDQIEWSFKKWAIKFAVENSVKYPRISKFILDHYKNEIYEISKFFIKRDLKRVEKFIVKEVTSFIGETQLDKDLKKIKSWKVNGKEYK